MIRRAPSLRALIAVASGMLVGACSLFTSFDDLSGGGAPPGEDAGDLGLPDGGGPTDAKPDAQQPETPDGGADADVPSAYRAVVLADEPVGYWRLADLAGFVAKDEIANQHPGTYYGGVTLGEPGFLPGERAARFDGTGCIKVGEAFRFPGGTPFSVEAWVKVAAPSGEMRIVSTETAPGTRNGYNLGVGPEGDAFFDGWAHDGTSNHYVLGVYSFVGAGTPLPLDAWNHIVATFEPDSEELWVNGERRDRQNQTGLTLNDRGTFTIGCSGLGVSDNYGFVDGLVADVAVYDKVLTGAQIIAHHRAGLGL